MVEGEGRTIGSFGNLGDVDAEAFDDDVARPVVHDAEVRKDGFAAAATSAIALGRSASSLRTSATAGVNEASPSPKQACARSP